MGRLLGIELGASQIKLLEASRYKDGLMIHKCSLIKMPDGCIENGSIIKLEPIYKVIFNELKSKRYRAKKVVMLVQSSRMIVRTAHVIEQSEKVLKQIIEMRAEEFLPIERKQYQVDFRVIQRNKNERAFDYFIQLVAVPNSVILPMMTLVRRLKCRPIRMTIPSEALTPLFLNEETMLPKIKGSIMVLDIGAESTQITIIDHEGLVLNRFIEVGIVQMMEAVERLKISIIGDEDFEGYDTDCMICAQLEYIILPEIEKVLRFYSRNYEKEQVEKIYLIGGGANIKGIRSYIRDALNLPTERINQLEGLYIETKVQFEEVVNYFVNLMGAIYGI